MLVLSCRGRQTHILTPPSTVCMRSVCVTYAVQKQHGLMLSHRTRLQSGSDPQTQHLSIILILKPNVVSLY